MCSGKNYFKIKYTLLVILTSVKSSFPVFTRVSSIVTIEAEYRLTDRVYRYSTCRLHPLEMLETNSEGLVVM